MKKKVSLLLAFIMTMAIGANAQVLYEKETQEIVTGGVTLRNIVRFYGDYALNINCITADLKNENLSLELLKDRGGVDKTQTVMNFAKAEENVVAATNADFFSAYKGDQNFSLGIEIKDGKFLQSHINSDMAAGFFKENVLSFFYPSVSVSVKAPNETRTTLSHINKPTDYYGALLMYTSDFNGGISPFLPEGITAVTVTEGKVSAKGVSLGGTIPIPENGYILVIDDNMTPFLDINFNVGDSVELSSEASTSLNGVETAFGGGTMLLANGEKTPITHDVKGNHPRTAIGTNADGTVVYMITVDGRQTESRGVSLDALADICLELGCVNALNFDGGGSTAMVGKTLFQNELHYINKPSENRKVINAVAITQSAQKGETVGFFAKAEKNTVLSGDNVKLSLTPYDENYNTPVKTTKEPKWVIAEGKGYVRDNVYYAEGSGNTVLELYYDNKKTDSVTLYVIDDVAGITADSKLSLSAGATITTENLIEVFDKYGNSATVKDITLLNPKYDEEFIELSGGTLKVLKEGSGKITLSHGRAKRDIKVISGKYDADIDEPQTDDALNKEESGAFTFNVLGFTGATNLFDRIAYARAMDTFRKADVSAVIGADLLSDLTPDAVSPVSAQKHTVRDFENAKLISMELSSKGVIERGSQWKKLSEALNSAKQKNIFVLLRGTAEFSADIDKAAFSSMLSDGAKNKNVFVIYSGSENFCRIDGGVRYISLADVKDEKILWKSIEKAKYLSFNITADSVTYCFKKLYG